jgi:hypothetical protein
VNRDPRLAEMDTATARSGWGITLLPPPARRVFRNTQFVVRTRTAVINVTGTTDLRATLEWLADTNQQVVNITTKE